MIQEHIKKQIAPAVTVVAGEDEREKNVTVCISKDSNYSMVD